MGVQCCEAPCQQCANRKHKEEVISFPFSPLLSLFAIEIHATCAYLRENKGTSQNVSVCQAGDGKVGDTEAVTEGLNIQNRQEKT